MTARRFWMNLGWLVVLVVTFAVAFTLDGVGRLTYFTSLTMWGVPIAYLCPLFLTITATGTGRRRRALLWTVGTFVVLGIVLDFLLGHLTLRFLDCDGASSPYVACLPAVGGRVPIEELLFYALGPAAIVLVYACADELWLSRYNPLDDLLNVTLIQVSPPLIVTAAIAAAVGIVIRAMTGHFPVYYAFLMAGALLPAIFLYRCVGALTNWPAFALAALYVVVTSVIWEATLAVPRGWWGYNPSGMIGVIIRAWSSSDRIFPIEAAFVWLCAPFSSVLAYEFAKALSHHPRGTREALFGPLVT